MTAAIKHGLARVLLCVLGILLALALTEVTLRILPLPDLRLVSVFQLPPDSAWKNPAWDDPPASVYRRQRVVGWEHAPGIDVNVALAEHASGGFRFRTNNLGLRRDADTSVPRSADLFRVLVLGDSHTDGYVDNDESFSTRLESELVEPLARLGKRVEVLNAGVVSYSPVQEALWFQVHGAELKPNVVLLIFYGGNDIKDVLYTGRPHLDSSAPSERPRDEKGSGLSEQLRIAALARYSVQVGPLAGPWRQFSLPGRLTEAGGYPVDTLAEVLRTCYGCFYQSLQQAALARRDPKAMQDGIAQAVGIMARLDREVRDAGSRLIVVTLPTRAEVEPALARPIQQRMGALLGLDETDLAFEGEVARVVVERLGTAGVATLPLHGALGKAAAEPGAPPLYYSYDWHLSPAGHRAAATALASGLHELGLL